MSTDTDLHVTVVGNGHISGSDRSRIRWQSSRAHNMIIRFNDMKSWLYDEPVDVHVTRIPSGLFPIFQYNAREWYVTVDALLVPSNAERVIVVFERMRGTENSLNDGRLFPDCSSCDVRCNHSWANMGPSTGAAVIDYLERDPAVKTIDVFGMNWNGDLPHNDFLYPTMVQRCCSKCTIHPTVDTSYGNEWGTMHTLVTFTALASFACMCAFWLLCLRRKREHRLIRLMPPRLRDSVTADLT